MLLNPVETFLINAPPRRWLQRYYETEKLLRIGGLLPDGKALDIGCGACYGTELILTRFGAATVDAVDPDWTMVQRAGRRLRRYGDRVRLHHGSADNLHPALGAESGSYDAVFNFAIIHHLPDWRTAVAEVSHVLTSGGRFHFEEVTGHALNRPSYRRLFDHPSRDRFHAQQFLDQLAEHGLVAIANRIRGDYLIGVAANPRSTTDPTREPAVAEATPATTTGVASSGGTP